MYPDIFEDKDFFHRFSLSSARIKTLSPEWRTMAMKKGLNRRTVGTEGPLVHGKITLWTKLLITHKLHKYKLAMRSLSYIHPLSLFVMTDVGWTRIFGENGEKQHKNSAF